MINKKNLTEIKVLANKQVIIAATKYVDEQTIKELVESGINNIGENRVDSFMRKYDILHDLDIVWHFIGHLQSNKVKKMINKIDFLHSLDRISLADEIQKHRKLPLNCFLEVNISNERSKYGLNVSEVYSFCEKIKTYDKIHIVGLMGMALLTDDKLEISREFMKLINLKKQINKDLKLNLKYLSMGMSNDYKIAIESGATHLRLGTILFRNEE